MRSGLLRLRSLCSRTFHFLSAPKVNFSMDLRPKVSLQSYLRTTQSILASARKGSDILVNVVLGNEGGDLDSVVSAVVYALQLSGASPNVLPVVNIPRADIVLRKDIPYAFQTSAIDLDLVPCIDDIDLFALHKDRRLRLTLVDHNRLAVHQEGLAESVTEIVDHHQDDKLYMQVKQGTRQIEEIGSNCSLITHKMNPALLDSSTATLLLSAILLDTNNFSPDKKFDKKDVSAAETLKKHLPSSLSVKKYYQRLLELRTDISGFTPSQILRRDVKFGKIENISFCTNSVTSSLRDVCKMVPDFAAQAAEYARNTQSQLMVVLFIFQDGESLRRQLMFVGESHDLVQQVASAFEQSNLQLERMAIPAGEEGDSRATVMAYTQKNVRASRKQVVPLLCSTLRAVKASL